MRILIADDDVNVRSALKLLLELEPGFLLCGEVTQSEDLLHQVAATYPEVILFDWELQEVGREKLLKTLRECYPNLSLVAMSSRPEALGLALEAGVDAFISKGEPADQLLFHLEDAFAK